MLPEDRTYIIAEIGPNHDGDVEKAKKLIDEAAKAKVDAVKFQLFVLDEIVSQDSPLAEYQKRSGEENQYDMLSRLLLSHQEMQLLKEHAEREGLQFLATPFDRDSAQFLADLGVQAMKIPSGEITNLPYMEYIASLKIFSIISTGMSTLEEVKEGVAPFQNAGTPFALLHCVSAYPTPVEQVNLRAMHTLENAFGVPVGFSDHTEGTAIPLAAVALGARIIEKHFTLNKRDSGPDHAASLEPDELTAMVRGIRDVEQALGTDEKQCQPCEIDTRNAARRSVVLTCSVQKGDTFQEEMLAIKRPGTGLEPKRLKEIVGKSATQDLAAGSILTSEDVEG